MGRKDLDLWSLDECHFQQHGSRYIMWVPPDVKDPILWHAPTHKKIGMFGAVRLKDGRLVAQQWEQFNGETFGVFLKHLLRHRSPKKKMVIILDNSRYHHARLLQPWLWDQRKILRLDYLPPYSPQLNPIKKGLEVDSETVRSQPVFSYSPRLDFDNRPPVCSLG